MTNVVLWVVISVLILLLCVSISFNIKFGLILLRVQDTLEGALDILDERYASMSKVLDIPIFYDSREVRQVVEDIRISRDSILDVAKALTTVEEEIPDETADSGG